MLSCIAFLFRTPLKSKEEQGGHLQDTSFKSFQHFKSLLNAIAHKHSVTYNPFISNQKTALVLNIGYDFTIETQPRVFPNLLSLFH